jgi:branched-subunit amino acid transport protein AzlD
MGCQGSRVQAAMAVTVILVIVRTVRVLPFCNIDQTRVSRLDFWR